MVLSAEYGHNRGSLVAEPKLMNAERDKLFERYLMGDRSVDPLRGVITQTQACGGAPLAGPFETRRWRGQHPGEVRVAGGAPQTYDLGRRQRWSRADRPVRQVTACAQTQATTDPGAATYESAPAGPGGLTLIGSPTVTATLAITGEYPQVGARLWDVAPNGTQTMVQHSSYLPRGEAGPQTFQLLPAGWAFRPGPRREARAARARLSLRAAADRRVLGHGKRPEPRAARPRAPDGGQVKPFAPPRP